MNIVSIIEKKRDQKVLTNEEIQFWVDGIISENIPEYQSSALLMAITLNGMTTEEISALTLAMMHSGDVIDLSEIEGRKVDKHSTGGVGDKTSLILSPIVAACGAKVAKMSGRGLGHTGGTLDKLESIPGFDISLESREFIDQVNNIGMAIIGQTGNLVPADKILYSLRDVTGTVKSIPLIASSIMSKKLAGGADCVLLDVKYGEGAFMKTEDEARELATTMINIGKQLNRTINAMISNMNQPLGDTIGNALEVKEAVDTLNNQGPKELEELCLVASGIMLHQAKLCASEQEGYEMALESLRSGAALKVFKQWISAQKGDVSVLEDLEKFTEAKYSVEIKSKKSGIIQQLMALELGLVSMHVGAGRQKTDDIIDMKAGIVLNTNVSDKIESGDLLCTLFSSNPINEKLIEETVDCFVIGDNPIEKPKLIADIL